MGSDNGKTKDVHHQGMKSLEIIMEDIESSKQEIIDSMMEMIRIPALAPINGGDGESKKADYLWTLLTGFDTVTRHDVHDATDPNVMRSNIIAVKQGKKEGTLWFVAHMDVVPVGDLELWDTMPFEPELKDGRIYGRGTEDDGQSVISSIFAAKQFNGLELEGMSLGLALVADEETGSVHGIQYLIDQGIFKPGDIIMVPDHCSPNGEDIDVGEKHILWLKVCVEGKTTHASTPNLGINAYKVSTLLLMDLIESFDSRFGDTNDLYLPKNSTFEPTKRIATVENVNTIPGYDEFCLDIRLNPEYDPDIVLSMVNETAQVYAESTGAKITVEVLQKAVAGRQSSIESEGFKALRDSVKEVRGIEPYAVGIGGGTCANFFRLKGFDAYAWQTGDGSLHAPNEYLKVDNLINDTKVFARVIYKLCM